MNDKLGKLSKALVQPVERESLSVRCYNALRDSLLDGQFGPGDRLLLRDLAGMLGISVTPIREACLRLVSESALEIRSRRFFHVPDLTYERYTQLRDLRILMEGNAAELAADRVGPERLKELRVIHQRSIDAIAAEDERGAFRSNRDFHLGVCAAAGFDMLYAHVEMLWVSMSPIFVLYFGRGNLYSADGGEHLVLLDALERRDGPAARGAISRDIQKGGENILKLLKPTLS